MSVSKTWAGATYALPQNREPKNSWGTVTSNFLIAIADQALAKTGGLQELTADLSFGATYGVIAAYIKSTATTLAASGVLRLGNTETIAWRNAGDTDDVALAVNDNDRLTVDDAVIPTVSSTDTITNKTLVVADNTVTTAASGNLAATELNTALAELQTDIDTRALDSDLDTHVADTSAHGVTGDVVGTTDTQTLTNKTLTTPVISTISNTGTLTLPTSTDTLVGRKTTDTLDNKTLGSPILVHPELFDYMDLDATDSIAAPGSDKLRLYAKSDNKLYTQTTAGIEQPVGSGAGGAGRKNYVSNPSAASATTDWSTSGTITLTRDTTTAIPRYTTTGTALKLVSAEDEAYIYTQFSLDSADLTRKLGLELAQAADNANYRVEMWKNSASDYSGTYTELRLSTDSDGDSYLPAMTGDYESAFDADGTSYLELRIVHNGTDSDTLYVSDITVTPDRNTVVGAARSADQVYTLTIGGSTTAPTLGTNTQEAAYSQDGQDMLLRYDLSQTAAGSAGSGTYLFPIPSGFTIAGPSSVSVDNSLGLGAVGFASVWDGTSAYTGTVHIYDSTHVYLVVGNQTSAQDVFGSSTISLAGATIRVSFAARVKIAEWAGNSTVNLIDQYTSVDTRRYTLTNLGSSGTPDSLGEYRAYYGTTGWFYSTAVSTTTVGKGSGSSGSAFRIDSTATIDGSEAHRIDLFIGRNMPGFQVHAFSDVDLTTPVRTDSLFYSSSSSYGLQSSYSPSTGILSVSLPAINSSTSTTVYPALDVSGFNTVESVYFYVTASSTTVPGIGFAEVIPGKSAGLVSANGLKGSTDGSSAQAGYVGEEIKDSAAMTVTSTVSNFMHLDLTPGVWAISALAVVNGTTSAVWVSLGISTTSASVSGLTDGDDLAYGSISSAGVGSVSIPRIVVNITSDTTYYAVGQINTSTVDGHVSMLATRIR